MELDESDLLPAAVVWILCLFSNPIVPSLRRADDGDDGVRVGAIADDVAEMPDGIDLARLGKDGVEGTNVRVDIGQDGDAHQGEGSRSATPRRCRRRWAGSRG